MARGLQKIEAQQKALAAKNKGGNSILKKDKGHRFTCAECKSEIDNKNNMAIHWEAKHPKLATPTDDFASMARAPPPPNPAKPSKKVVDPSKK
ncbi:uncharacterized protein LY89DRAFT_743076 [Mollisia scopiformis]|uniref:C2H2-type domain-containing protein n=1 Tax=Mollisia scopiformis TaxID=149040 RepID=A0A132B3U0_MOLSC|nr:uncharacterized protein LY89DRAFT_743076 [Mollisia scopiformis]KUJ07075.1 hypothetical protein LY89DRAFT_743076 [Mollisia scopiformis]